MTEASDLRAVEAEIAAHVRRLNELRTTRAHMRRELAKGRDVEPLQRSTDETPRDFARRVAEQYRRALLRTRYPATMIAEVSQVRVRTVHAWVARARELGELPPGQQGKVG